MGLLCSPQLNTMRFRHFTLQREDSIGNGRAILPEDRYGILKTATILVTLVASIGRV
jgi:hypothetical protein